MHRSDESPDLPNLRWRAALSLLKRLPQGAFSRGFGRLADAPIPPALRPAVLGAFARAVGADPSEAELPLEAYPTLNRFFTRKLKDGVRSWPADPATVASPVDGPLVNHQIVRTLVERSAVAYLSRRMRAKILYRISEWEKKHAFEYNCLQGLYRVSWRSRRRAESI
ncbi:MAG TPA: phosphatidylserine decarboxylase [Longimicrobium sp.]|jgi:hypothetical protein|uniref:phosphatidylserine decarboxylase n=1 Tax=Longimicrobium sp. TaxID=2029185 RepID=UPI002ED9877D